jgi:DNA-binding protein HU-beta
MTTHELTRKVAADADITGGQAKSAVNTAFDAIARELAADRDVAIADFGKFSVSERSARDERNPATDRRSRSPPAGPRSSPRPRP